MDGDHLNSGLEGARVVRGPDWRWSNQDGGEGFIGTVVTWDESVDPTPGKLLVTWDCGNSAIYRAGYDGAFDLRVVDNAAIGVRHGVQCEQGCPGEIAGLRWRCVACDVSLCSACYFNDRHKSEAHHLEQEYDRFDTRDSEPVRVLKKQGSKVELKGIFLKARVKCGRDWKKSENVAEADSIGIGEVTGIHPTDGLAQVKWSNESTLFCRLGADGKVDVRLKSHASGGWYHPEHLPLLKLKHPNINATGEIKFAEGDRVRVNVDASTFKSLQGEKHGGWNSEMASFINKPGKVKCLYEKSARVCYGNGKTYWINPAALERMDPFSIGQPVRVKDDAATRNAMDITTSQIIGKTGRVRNCCSDSEVEVVFDGYADHVARKLRAELLEILPVSKEIMNKYVELKVKLVHLFLEAAGEGQLYVLKDLQATRKVNVNDQGVKGTTALHEASRRGQLDVMKWLLKNGARVNLCDNGDRMAVHHAAEGCQQGALELLIAHGANLDDRDSGGLTPLQVATKAGCVKCVRILIQSKCNINSQDPVGDTALYNTIIYEAQSRVYRDHELVDILLPSSNLALVNGKGLNALHLAATLGNSRALEQILLSDQGAQLIDTTEEKSGFTTLHSACYKGDVESVKLILKHCKSVAHVLERRATKQDWTPLLVAAYKGHYGVVEYLIGAHEDEPSFRADVTAKDCDGDTAAHLVAINLESLSEKPTKTKSPKIFEIYEELLLKYPDGELEKLPALALMCYLIREGCPWKKTFNRRAILTINNDVYRKMFLAYSTMQSEAELSAGATIDFCILCGSDEKSPPGVIPICGDTCKNICLACVSFVKRCPECGKPNNTSARNSTDIEMNFDYAYFNKYSGAAGQPSSSQPTEMEVNEFDMSILSSLQPSSSYHQQQQPPTMGNFESLPSAPHNILNYNPAAQNAQNAFVQPQAVHRSQGNEWAPSTVASLPQNNPAPYHGSSMMAYSNGNAAEFSSASLPVSSENWQELASLTLNISTDNFACGNPSAAVQTFSGQHAPMADQHADLNNPALGASFDQPQPHERAAEAIGVTQPTTARTNVKDRYIVHDGFKFSYQRRNTYQCTRTSNHVTKAKCPAILVKNDDGTITTAHSHRHAEQKRKKRSK